MKMRTNRGGGVVCENRNEGEGCKGDGGGDPFVVGVGSEHDHGCQEGEEYILQTLVRNRSQKVPHTVPLDETILPIIGAILLLVRIIISKDHSHYNCTLSVI